jgi:hypothetical protein
MKELIIYEFQAKRIEDTLRLAANLLKSHTKETCLDRDIMQSWEMIKNVLNQTPDKFVSRLTPPKV